MKQDTTIDRCNDKFCTKRATTEACAACEAFTERDRFFRFWFQGGWLIDGLRALKQWRQSTKKHGPKVDRSNRGVTSLVPPRGHVHQQGLWERAERLRGAADDAARLVQNFYISFLLLGTYIAVIIGSTTDVQLLKINPVTLPLLNVQLPIVGFYVFVPWLLLLFYFNLLLQLTLLAQKLHRLNAVLAVFADDAAREEQRVRLFPFPFSAMLIGRPAQWRMRVLLALMVWTTVVLLPLALLLWAQLRFLPYHDTAITWNHRAAVLVDLALLWLFWPLMLMPGQRWSSAAHTIALWKEEQRAVRRTAWTRRLRWGTGLLCLTLITVVFSLGTAVLPEEGMETWMAAHLRTRWRHVDPPRGGKGVFKLTYWLFETPGAPFHRNLWLQEQVLVAGEPSAEVLTALLSGDEHKRAQGLEKIAGLTLTNRDLRGADLRDTLFVKGDLRGANLKGANLVGARVFAANLSTFPIFKGWRCVEGVYRQHTSVTQTVTVTRSEFTDVQQSEVDSCGTNLQGANLQGTELQDANLRFAQLQGADLQHALLQGAHLWGAELHGANLQHAQLQGADLQHAHIRSADFTGADLMLSNLQGLSLSPLDEETYKQLEQRLTDTIRDENRRADVLKQLKAAVGRPTQLKPVRSDQVLCNEVNLLPSCLTQDKIAVYARARAWFLVTLGCQDAAIARGVTRQMLVNTQDPMQMAFAKRFTTIQEKDCPGWAALPGDLKDELRKQAAGKPSAP